MKLIQVAMPGRLAWYDEDSEVGREVAVVLGLNGKPEELIDEEKNPGSTERMFDAFYATPLGQRFQSEFGTSTVNPATGIKNIKAVEAVFERLYKTMSLSRLIDTVQTMMDAGELARPPKPAAPAAPRPRTDDGQFANAHWAEYLRMLNDPSTPSDAITRRLNDDRVFREAVEAGKKRELGVTTAAAPTVALDDFESEDRQRIERFARDWEQSPRIPTLIGGYRTTISGDRYSAAEFERNLEFVSKYKLIRQ